MGAGSVEVPCGMARFSLTNPDWGRFTLTGELGQRLQRSVLRLLELQLRLFTETRIIRGYGSAEIASNWLEAMEMVCRYAGGRYTGHLREVAEEMLVHQQPYGGFCADVETPHMRVDHWVGDQRALGGLLAAWRVLRDPRYLQAACRTAEYLMGHWPQDFNAIAVNTWGSRKYCVEPYFYSTLNFVELHAQTGRAEHLEFARRICLLAPRLRPDAEVEHADGRMMNLLGLLHLYGVTGEHTLLDAAVNDARVIADHFMWPSGGIPEMLPDNLRDEACQTANWVRLNLALWRHTGRSACLDLVERTWLNHLYFDQHPNGGFCWGRTLRRGGSLSQRASENGEPFEMWYCCSETAPRALLDLGRHAVAIVDDQPAIILWAAGRYQLPGCRVEIEHDIAPGVPLQATVDFDQQATLSVRLPARSEIMRMTVDGREIGFAVEQGWVKLPSLRQARIALELRYVPGLESHNYPRFVSPGGDANNVDALWDPRAFVNYTGIHKAWFVGPWMLKGDYEEEEWFATNQRYREMFAGVVPGTA